MNRFIAYAASVFAAIWLLLSALMSTAFNDELYDTFQRWSGVTAESSRLSEEARMSMNRELSMYLAGEGELSEAFNARERAHMADVKALFDTARTVMTICFALAALLAVCAFLRARDLLIKRYLIGGGVMAALFVLISLCAAIDFDGVFELFHKLLFSNQLWILDIDTDPLIRILPEKWFMYMGITILLRTIGRMAALWLFLRAAVYLVGRSVNEA